MDFEEDAFYQWYNFEATEDEKVLYSRIADDFGILFEDMIFRPGTYSSELTKCYSELSQGEIYDILPDELANFDYFNFYYKAEQPDDCDGYFNREEKTLCASPDAADSTILHEMIHLHEFVINQLPMYWHDTLYWALYKNLRDKIPELDTIITDHAHLLNESVLYKQGGLHDILFLLKSFDLDIKMRYPLGTVLAYGRAEDFKKYSYKNE